MEISKEYFYDHKDYLSFIFSTFAIKSFTHNKQDIDFINDLNIFYVKIKKILKQKKNFYLYIETLYFTYYAFLDKYSIKPFENEDIARFSDLIDYLYNNKSILNK